MKPLPIPYSRRPAVRTQGQLCSRSHPNQTSSGPPKPFAAIPGSAALNNLPQVHWEHDCTDRHVHFARKRVDLGRPARQNTWLPHLPHLGEVHDHQRWISAVLEGGYTQPALPACSRLETRQEEQHGRGEYFLLHLGAYHTIELRPMPWLHYA